MSSRTRDSSRLRPVDKRTKKLPRSPFARPRFHQRIIQRLSHPWPLSFASGLYHPLNYIDAIYYAPKTYFTSSLRITLACFGQNELSRYAEAYTKLQRAVRENEDMGLVRVIKGRREVGVEERVLGGWVGIMEELWARYPGGYTAHRDENPVAADLEYLNARRLRDETGHFVKHFKKRHNLLALPPRSPLPAHNPSRPTSSERPRPSTAPTPMKRPQSSISDPSTLAEKPSRLSLPEIPRSEPLTLPMSAYRSVASDTNLLSMEEGSQTGLLGTPLRSVGTLRSNVAVGVRRDEEEGVKQEPRDFV